MSQRNPAQHESWYFTPFSDGEGVVGYYFHCGCGHTQLFTQDCDRCGFEIDVDADDWYDAEILKPINLRAWNRGVEK